ncbi:hypothetical protein B0T25DRAFT_521957 [Lasiosphaeria hispida]|uniref:Uncharacterized protein n=1 Tax=Lasiosphaeria hispida TaxID=260671 RepID=A0AAJ0H8S7_9PEZI|nr:hypothetical protein B0T25DRAFT_521957 [Lasiosphaeria hispida]
MSSSDISVHAAEHEASAPASHTHDDHQDHHDGVRVIVPTTSPADSTSPTASGSDNEPTIDNAPVSNDAPTEPVQVPTYSDILSDLTGRPGDSRTLRMNRRLIACIIHSSSLVREDINWDRIARHYHPVAAAEAGSDLDLIGYLADLRNEFFPDTEPEIDTESDSSGPDAAHRLPHHHAHVAHNWPAYQGPPFHPAPHQVVVVMRPHQEPMPPYAHQARPHVYVYQAQRGGYDAYAPNCRYS